MPLVLIAGALVLALFGYWLIALIVGGYGIYKYVR